MGKPLMLTLLVEHIAEGQQRLPAATAKHLGLPELKRFIVKSRIGKAARRRRSSSSSSSSSNSSLNTSRSSLNASSSSLGSSLGMSGLSMAPPPPPLEQPVVQRVVPLAPLELQLDIAPEPFAVGRTYECPSPSLSSHSSHSDSEMSDGGCSSSAAATVPDLSDMDADTWALLPDYDTAGSLESGGKFDESAMIDQMLAKLAAEDAALAGADGAQLFVIGEGIQAPHGFSGLALL